MGVWCQIQMGDVTLVALSIRGPDLAKKLYFFQASLCVLYLALPSLSYQSGRLDARAAPALNIFPAVPLPTTERTLIGHHMLASQKCACHRAELPKHQSNQSLQASYNQYPCRTQKVLALLPLTVGCLCVDCARWLCAWSALQRTVLRWPTT